VKEGANPEMDQIRKLVSGRLKAQTPGPHPDPDMLAAFAEKALSETERAQLLRHLGACSDCREILYLAMPDAHPAQEALSFQPKPRFGFALRWGTLVASVAIAAGLLATMRHKAGTAGYEARVVMPKSTPSAPAQIAKQEPPAELTKMRDELAIRKADTPSRSVELPEKKHMTASPAAHLDFDDSDQVRISSGLEARADAKESRSRPATASPQNLPLDARNLNERGALAPGASEGAMLPKPNEKDKAQSASAMKVAAAQKAITGGNLGGVVYDATGAAIADAKITATGPNGSRTATSDRQGKFVFDRLSPGLYSVKTEASGFQTREDTRVAVAANESSNLKTKLQVGSTSETVAVSAAAAPVATTTAESRQVSSYNQVTGEVVGEKQQQTAQLTARKASAAAKPASIGAPASAPAFQWTLSPTGRVQRSGDSGKTWQFVPVGNHATFRSLSAVGNSIWAGGDAGALYHSVDAGQTWLRTGPVFGGQTLESDITHIDFSDATTGSINTSDGQTWTTSDSGKSWSRK
jgi:hypothetical protein